MDVWKKERISVVDAFLNKKDYIILRGEKSWTLDSDIDVLCPSFKQDEPLKRYIVDAVKIDIFTIYKIKNIKIKYEKLVKYKKNINNELDENVEAILFFLKDYIHLTKFRKNKHLFYPTPKKANIFLNEINCPTILTFFLKPSKNIVSFIFRSTIVKVIYYTTK